jgi:beta-glucuronidase
MAVPGAWNDRLAERGLKNHPGSAWYGRSFNLSGWDPSTQRFFLRVGAAEHREARWINGLPVGLHEGGHLRFAFDISHAVGGGTNRLTPSVDSHLTMDTVPQGFDREMRLNEKDQCHETAFRL